MKYTREQIKAVMSSKGYKYFENDNYDVNIIGVRNSATGTEITNKFDDTMTISYKDEEIITEMLIMILMNQQLMKVYLELTYIEQQR